MKQNIKKIIAQVLPLVIFFILVAPSFTHAQTPPTPVSSCPSSITDVATLFRWGTCMISNSIIPLLFAVALIAFLYGVIRYFMNANDSTKRAEGSQFMIWGIVALFVMLSVWGLVGILSNTFNLNNSQPTPPVFR